MISKYFAPVAALVVGCALLCGAAAPATGILWQTDLEAAKRIAAQTNRLILVHFWEPNCGPCKQLEQDVFSQAQVQQEIQTRFVPVKLNAQDWPTTIKTYGITRYPTDLVITPSGQIVGRMISPLKPDVYLQQLAIAASGTGPAATPGASSYVASMAGGAAPATSAPIIQPGAPMTGGAAQTPAAWGATQPGAAQQTSSASPAPAMPNYSDSRYADFFQKYGGTIVGQVSNLPSQTAAAPAPTQTAPAVAVSPATSSSLSPYVAGSGSMLPPLGATPQLSSTTMQPQVSAPPIVGQVSNLPIQAAPQTTSLPAPPPLGLEGFCPVTLAEQSRWQVGDRRWGVIHRGRTYLFAGPTEQQKFLSNPDRYGPAASGQDVVMALDYGQAIDGKRALGREYQGRIYLFSSEASLNAFVQNRDRYAAQVLQAENPGQTTLR